DVSAAPSRFYSGEPSEPSISRRRPGSWRYSYPISERQSVFSLFRSFLFSTGNGFCASRFFHLEGDSADRELKPDLNLNGEASVVVRDPDVEMAGAAEQHVVEQVDLVEDGVDRPEVGLEHFAPLGLHLRHDEFLAIADRNLGSLARLHLHITECDQAADEVVDTRGDRHLLSRSGVLRQIFFEEARFVCLRIIGNAGFFVAVAFLGGRDAALGAEAGSQDGGVFVAYQVEARYDARGLDVELDVACVAGGTVPFEVSFACG